jgi:hypothetical protein
MIHASKTLITNTIVVDALVVNILEPYLHVIHYQYLIRSNVMFM